MSRNRITLLTVAGSDGIPTISSTTAAGKAPTASFRSIGKSPSAAVFPALPKVDVFVVAQFEFEKSLVLAWRQPDGKYQTTWAFVLHQPQPGQTRLIVRGRAAPGYRPLGLPEWAAMLLARPAHFVMQRKQLLEIAHRAESHAQTTRPAESTTSQ